MKSKDYDQFTSLSIAFSDLNKPSYSSGVAYFHRAGQPGSVVEIPYSSIDDRSEHLIIQLSSVESGVGIIAEIKEQKGIVVYGDGVKFGSDERPAFIKNLSNVTPVEHLKQLTFSTEDI